MAQRRSRGTARRPAPLWLYLASGAFILYYGTLLYSDLVRVESPGLLIDFHGGAAEVRRVVDGSPAARVGLRPGDRVERFAGGLVTSHLDWTAIATNLVIGRPVVLEYRRDGEARQATVTLGPSPVLLGVGEGGIILRIARVVQASCLVFAVLVAFKRPGDEAALLGGWLLASLGVFSVVLPYGFAHHWRQLPWPASWLMWGPFASSVAGMAVFFAFAARFPRALLGPRAIVALCLPMVGAVAWHAWYGYVAVARQATIPVGIDGSAIVITTGMVYAAAGLGLLIAQYLRTTETNERRRIRVLVGGAAIGIAAGVLVEWRFWLAAAPKLTESYLAAPSTLVGTILLLAFPGAFAYAILRQRLFEVRFMVRQGVRYALARRLLLSLVPLLVLVVTADLFVQRNQSMADVIARRGWRYAVVGGALVAVIMFRRRWLDALDRRFFRERYHAEQLLRAVADNLRGADDPAKALATVVQQIEQALKPSFVAALDAPAGSGGLRVVASAPDRRAPLRLGPDSTLMQVAHALRKPLDLSPDRDTWVIENLPPEEATAVWEAGLELLVPVTQVGHPVALALGPKRSEEPYSGDDMALLQAIAASLALVIERRPAAPPHEEPGLAECPVCSACFDTSMARCPADGALLLASDLPRVLGGRYEIAKRIGAGGMGEVYRAHDSALGRDVAVKVVREHLVGSPDAARRFEREARTAAALSHPNIVTVHDLGVTSSGRAFLVMELLHGRSIREELRHGGPFDRPRVVAIARQICDALDLAHQSGLVHRDLKPENVLLTASGGGEVAKILDFGIAKALEDPNDPGDGTFTGSGVVVGSLPYMSPEQLAGGRPQPSWDLWALAVMTFELLMGSRPDPSSPQAPGPPIRDFFVAALDRDPVRRPRTAHEFHDRLARALEG